MSETLFEIIQRLNPEQLGLLRQPLFSQKAGLEEEEREALRETLAEEFCEFGLKEDSRW